MISKVNPHMDSSPRMASLPNSQAHRGALQRQIPSLQAGISSGTKIASAGTTLKRPREEPSGIRQSPRLAIYRSDTKPLVEMVDMAVAMAAAITNQLQVLYREGSMVSSIP